jgi:hypothetical protein
MSNSSEKINFLVGLPALSDIRKVYIIPFLVNSMKTNRGALILVLVFAFSLLAISTISAAQAPLAITGRVITHPEEPLFGFGAPYPILGSDRSNVLTAEINNQNKIEIAFNYPGAYTYQEGYYWNPSTLSWVQYQFPQPTVTTDAKWIGENAAITLDVDPNSLISSGLSQIYIVAYFCKRDSNNEWKCGCSLDSCSHWNLQTIGDAPPPSIPPAPKIVVTSDDGSTLLADFNEDGNIALKGSCEVSTSCDTVPVGSYAITNTAGEVVAYIDDQGNLCAEGGSCTGGETTCPDPTQESQTIFSVGPNDASSPTITIDNTGALCFKGTLTTLE